MRKIFSLLIFLIIIFGLTVSTPAILIDMGDGTVYDTDTKLTWLKDAQMGGLRTWVDALNWADTLVFAGFYNWRLPLTVPAPHITYNLTESEMGHLYYTELENPPALGGPASPLNPGPFTMEQRTYWTGTSGPGQWAYAFNFSGGGQGLGMIIDEFGAWAVREGDRSEPIAIDIKPNSINLRGTKTISVAILSWGDFYAPEDVFVDGTTLRFGPTGEENSLLSCGTRKPRDINGDGVKDLVCQFSTTVDNLDLFSCGDTEGILRGVTVEGIPFEGSQPVVIRPCK